MLWRQYKLKPLNSSPSVCLSWRHIQTTVKLMLLCVSRAIKLFLEALILASYRKLSLNVPTLVSPLVPYGYLY